VYVFNVPYLNYCIFHYVTLNGFDDIVIMCWYKIFYELFVLNFIIKMYYGIQKKFFHLDEIWGKEWWLKK